VFSIGCWQFFHELQVLTEVQLIRNQLSIKWKNCHLYIFDKLMLNSPAVSFIYIWQALKCTFWIKTIKFSKILKRKSKVWASSLNSLYKVCDIYMKYSSVLIGFTYGQGCRSSNSWIPRSQLFQIFNFWITHKNTRYPRIQTRSIIIQGFRVSCHLQSMQ